MLTARVGPPGSGPWGLPIGIARSLLALTTLISLIATPTSRLFFTGQTKTDLCGSLPIVNIYCSANTSQYWIVTGCFILVLLAVIIGYRPQITCWAHAYVTYCFATAVTVPVGGDQIAQNLALLLIPVCLTWRGRWHWNASLSPTIPGWRELVAWTSITAIGLQAVVLYSVAFISKLAVMEWTDGTAIYYWLGDPMFGPAGWLGDIARTVTSTALGTGLATFGALAVEAGLAVAFLYSARGKQVALFTGIAFHGLIAVTMGLYTFSGSMAALLIIYLADHRRPSQLSIATMRRRIRTGFTRISRDEESSATPLASTTS